MEIVINYWAVLLCVVMSIVLGSLWYGPLFGKQWMRLAGIQKPESMTPAIKKSMIQSYVIMAVGSLFMAFVLAHFLFYASAFTRMVGIEAGLQGSLWVWLGFVAPVTIGSVLWESKPWKYWFITAGYYLVSLSIMGVILSLWV